MVSTDPLRTGGCSCAGWGRGVSVNKTTLKDSTPILRNRHHTIHTAPPRFLLLSLVSCSFVGGVGGPKRTGNGAGGVEGGYPNKITTQQKSTAGSSCSLCNMEQLHVRLSSMCSLVKLPDVCQRSVTSSVTHQMAMQISSVTVQKDDSVQLLKQTPSRHSGLDASHHLHRLELRWLKDWTTRGSPAGETHAETTLQLTATTLALPATLSDHKHNDRRRNKTLQQAFANVRRH